MRTSLFYERVVGLLLSHQIHVCRRRYQTGSGKSDHKPEAGVEAETKIHLLSWQRWGHEDKEWMKRDIKRMKRDIKWMKRDIERMKRDIKRMKRDLRRFGENFSLRKVERYIRI